MQRDRPIFVLGCPRSGTTMLQLMLHAHPRIAIPPENRFVLPSYVDRRRYGDLREPGNRRRLAQDIVGVTRAHTQFRDLKLDADEITEAIAAGPPSVGSALGIVFRAYAHRFDKPRWGDKRPAYYRYLPFLRRMFPDAQFVQIVRDGRACVASLKRMPWWHRDVYTAVAEWATSFDTCQRYAGQLPADTFHQVRYESLVADPAAELSRLCAFLGEEYHETMSQPRSLARTAVPRRKRTKWHRTTRTDVSDNQVAKWREELEPWEISLCESALGERLRSYGYELSGTEPVGARHRARYAERRARLAFYVRRQLLTDRVRALTETQPVADLGIVEYPSAA